MQKFKEKYGCPKRCGWEGCTICWAVARIEALEGEVDKLKSEVANDMYQAGQFAGGMMKKLDAANGRWEKLKAWVEHDRNWYAKEYRGAPTANSIAAGIHLGNVIKKMKQLESEGEDKTPPTKPIDETKATE